MKDLKKILARITAEGGKLERTARLIPVISNPERADGEAEEYRFELSFSSEEPYERWFGVEILGHKKSEVRLDWIKGGTAPLFLNHDRTLQPGVIDSAKLEDSRGKAVVRFGKSALAQEVRQDVIDGIKVNVSVGYRVHEMKLEKTSDKEPDRYRVTDWEPLEISIVGLPADRTIGADDNRRSEDDDPPRIQTQPKEDLKMKTLKERAVAMGLSEDACEEAVLKAERAAAIAEGKAAAKLEHQAETSRCEAIRTAGKAHGMADEADAAITAGRSAAEFTDAVLAKYAKTKVQPASADLSIGEKRDVQGFSFARFLAGTLPNARMNGVEAEMVQEAILEGKRLGYAVEGAGIPSMLLRNLMVQTRATAASTSATEGGEFVQTTVMPFIDALHNKMVMSQLGATIMSGLSGNISIPRIATAPSATSQTEVGALTDGTLVTDSVELGPKRSGVTLPFSKTLLLQSSQSVENVIRNLLLRAMALRWDYLAINGSGANAEPTGVLNFSGIGAVVGGLDGAAPTEANIIGLETAVAVDNADVGSLSYLTNTSVRGKLKSTPIVAGHPDKVWMPGAQPLNGYGCQVSNQVPKTLTKGTSSLCSAIMFGNWADLYLAFFGVLDVVTDPFALKKTAQIEITMNQWFDVGAAHAESFAAMKDALTA